MTTTWLVYFPSPPRGVWHLGPIPIRAYALCIIVGIIAALLIGDRRWQARGGEPGVIYDIALWTVPFGLIGGRLYHLATDWQTYFGANGIGWAATPRIWDGGLGIWGAVALGGVGTWIGCRRRGIPLPAFADAVAPGVVLAQAIGRIGNYFNQELYGRETALPWGMEIFWREDAAGLRDPHLLDGVSTGELYKIVQPTFLYELLWNLLVFAVLIYADRRFRLGHRRLFALYVAGYCIGRFGIELLRDDTATHIAGIRINSFTSTFVFIGAVVYFLLAAKGREDPDVLRRSWQQVDAEQPDTQPGEPEAESAGDGETPEAEAEAEQMSSENAEADAAPAEAETEMAEPQPAEADESPEPAGEESESQPHTETAESDAEADESPEPTGEDETPEPESTPEQPAVTETAEESDESAESEEIR